MTLAADFEQQLDTPSRVLTAVRERRRAADRAEAEQLELAVQWCLQHPAEHVGTAAWSAAFGDQVVGLAGEGAPMVSEFAVEEFAAALGMSTDTGRAYLGEALELRYRLPRLWERVTRVQVPAWKARLVARRTMALPEAGAEFVDRHLAPVAATIGVAALQRLVEEAEVRFDPDAAETRRLEQAEARHVSIQTRQLSFDGHVEVMATLDVADALYLEEAVTKGAAVLAALGSQDLEGARRARALGEMARRDLTLTYDTDPAPLVVHVHQAPTPDHADGEGSQVAAGEVGPVVRVENTRSFVLAGQLAEWCTHAARVTIKPVIDLEGRVHVEGYEVPDRLKDHVGLRDHHCVFPHCTRPATRCEHDHVLAHGRGGPTCSCNIALLCTRHHRIKTHGGWTYEPLVAGTYLWTSPHRLRYLVDPTGTHDANRHHHHHDGLGPVKTRPETRPEARPVAGEPPDH
ncbi:HNH endonuclease signature motif containing protein [Nocardioides sp. SYSU DS0663]|uniref:HNH endonuclease signature motif containing protein n=1 Tax=Nocardioides sp. SYSU DS0663 TaxID=3416445 RepID=UPI003F4C3EE4